MNGVLIFGRFAVLLAVIGIIVVTAAVIGGYIMEHGNLSILVQPAEWVIIGGAALGGFLIAYPTHVAIEAGRTIIKILTGSSGKTKAEYIDTLRLLGDIFNKVRRDGLLSIDKDVDRPEKSAIFTKHKNILKDHRALAFITDTLRLALTSVEPHEIDALADSELEAAYEEAMAPSRSVANIADSLPGLGIVAAVLGVVLTMQKMGEPPEVLGHSIGAALVGTFMGVLLCYGFVGPMARNMEQAAAAELEYLMVLKTALMAFIHGSAPQIAVEFGRRVIPLSSRPTFLEMESALKARK